MIALTAAGWIFYKRDYKLGFGLVVAIAITALFVAVLKTTMQVPRPNDVYTGVHAFSFPSGHASYAAAIYGVLGWIWWQGLQRPWRDLVLWGLAGLVTSIAFSRVYLQVHWPSDVLAGLVFGVLLTSAFALVFRNRDFRDLGLPGMTSLCLGVFLAVGSWHISASHADGVEKYARHVETTATTSADWLATGWRTLPSQRVELGGDQEEPVVLQWAGPLQTLVSSLKTGGWTPGVPMTVITSGRYLRGDTAPRDLPVLPRMNDGRTAVATLVRAEPGAQKREVLYLWTSNRIVTDKARLPILVGIIIQEAIEHRLGVLSVPVEVHDNSATIDSELASMVPNAVTKPGPHIDRPAVILGFGD